ncbi:MAG: DNA mismatch repair endonuclease MutL [Clostridiales bacterium]|nr:DNA mismatch repair endonuclease MutL [Clostridiales bacterium]
MSKIKVLPMQIANLIAAGEVVDRPASVVKELLENAMDACATAVSVEVEGGGVSLIRVTDNGCGMSREDALACFGRHATSKIRQVEDLAAISTLGFRGEALAAVASVSRVTLRTREPGSDEGVELQIEGGQLRSCEACGCPAGTDVLVRDLFFNTPARKKFLKKESTETATISSLLERLALSKPALALHYRRDGRDSLRTSGGGDLLETACAVLGERTATGLLPVDHGEGGIRIHGLIGRPEASRPGRQGQNFFVAGRYVRSRVLQLALEEAYKGSLMGGRYPLCVLFVELHPARVDVNVHPQKMELKFADERAVYDALYNAVRAALTEKAGRPPIRAAEEMLPPPPSPPPAEPPASSWRDFAAAAESIAMQAASSGPTLVSSRNRRIDIDPGDWTYYGDLAVGHRSRREEAAPLPPAPEAPSVPEGPPEQAPAEPPAEAAEPDQEAAQATLPIQEFRMVGELFRTYYVAEFAQEVWLVDKHAARERLLYEALLAQDGPRAQQLLEPLLVETGRAVSALVGEYGEVLCETGLEAEAFGESTVLLRSLPMGVEAGQGGALLMELCTLLEEGRRSRRPVLLEEMLHRAACTAAVKGGDREPPGAGEALVRQLLALPDLRHCPHGRPCVKVLPRRYFEREFMRI